MLGGDLAHYVKLSKKKAKDNASAEKDGKGEPCAGLDTAWPGAMQFYIASTALALEALHLAGFVYRDLKDKDILLDASAQQSCTQRTAGSHQKSARSESLHASSLRAASACSRQRAASSRA
eukprot:7376728-Prymnesium_polylepis.1